MQIQRLRLSRILVSLCLGFLAFSKLQAEELVLIHAISETKKSFVLIKGAEEGFEEGAEAMFFSDDYAIVAKVERVSRNLSYWKIVNEEAILPFKKGDFVTLN